MFVVSVREIIVSKNAFFRKKCRYQKNSYIDAWKIANDRIAKKEPRLPWVSGAFA